LATGVTTNNEMNESNESYKQEYRKYIDTNWSVRYKNKDIFDRVKSVRSNLKEWHSFAQWQEVFGTRTDILNPNLETYEAVKSLHMASNLLSKLAAAHTPAVIGLIMVQLSKFCVPILACT
jgi:hypothetical protein